MEGSRLAEPGMGPGSITVALTLLGLLVVANGVPVLARRLFKNRWSAPIDGGRLAWDGRPLLGASKTWRGLLTGIAGAGIASGILGPGLVFGLVFGLAALMGDLLSSFIKRRAGLASSARATSLDQLPESLLPMLVAAFWLGLGWLPVVIVPVIFMLAHIWVSPLLYRIGIRRQPH